MTRKELAEMLDGREYRHEIAESEIEAANVAGLVVVFGASDDLIEIHGAMRDEVDSWEGAEILVGAEGLYRSECDDEDCPHEKALAAKCKTIDVKWEHNGFSWWIDSKIPHDHFVIKYGGENYCRGIVYHVDDAKPEVG